MYLGILVSYLSLRRYLLRRTVRYDWGAPWSSFSAAGFGFIFPTAYLRTVHCHYYYVYRPFPATVLFLSRASPLSSFFPPLILESHQGPLNRSVGRFIRTPPRSLRRGCSYSILRESRSSSTRPRRPSSLSFLDLALITYDLLRGLTSSPYIPL